MPAVSITAADLAPFAEIPDDKAQEMIADALATAKLIAPCIVEDSFEHAVAAIAVLRRAILRWNEAGTGAVVQTSSDVYQQTIDNRQPSRNLFWPSQISQLQQMCRTESGAWSYDTVPAWSSHADVCAINFGAQHCSCGAILTTNP